ncbi:MAG: MFS transporter [Chloroflexi bacterium]|nr:MFS transporter [Chloroflexota bacterium]
MLTRLRNTIAEYPSQFWLMVVGLFISSAGASMIWPFLMIYVSEKLSLSLSAVSTLITINAIVGLFASFIAGAVSDKLGRKLVMVVSLTVNGIGYLFMSQAHSYLGFALIMVLMGASNPLYQVGSDAMLADMIVPEKRTNAYAIIRMINNAGIAVGPAMGGFLATRSYTYAFLGAALGMLTYSLLLFFRARETLNKAYQSENEPKIENLGGYGRVFKDRPYVVFALLVGIGLIAPAMLWTLFAVYTKQNFGLPENLYGWLPTTNALMCVFVQFPLTQVSRRFRPLPVIGVGMLIYALGVGSVALMNSFWGFWASMVLMTFGELTLIPTVSKYIADLAPADMRGRYMSFYWFAWGIARGAAPLIGGFLNDNISPRSIWIGGLTIGLASTIGLFIFSARKRDLQPA